MKNLSNPEAKLEKALCISLVYHFVYYEQHILVHGQLGLHGHSMFVL